MRSTVIASSVAMLLLAGCVGFRDEAPLPPQKVDVTDVDLGLPTTLPSEFPLPQSRDAGRTYHRTGKNNLFFSTEESIPTLRSYFEQALADAGYTVRSTQEEENDGVTIHFERDGKLGYVHLLTTVPSRYVRQLDLTGTFVEIVFEISPPPAPIRTVGPTS